MISRLIAFALIAVLGVGIANAGECETNDDLLKMAEAKDPQAMYEMGKAYQFGSCIDTDYSKALYWYIAAMEEESDDARYAVALMFRMGLGIEKNVKVAELLLRNAAENGHQLSIVELVNGLMVGFKPCDRIDYVTLLKTNLKDEMALAMFNEKLYEHMLDSCSRSKGVTK